MNTTNRTANRLLLLIVGLLLLAAGAAAALLALLAGFGAAWTQWFRTTATALPAWATAVVVGKVGWIAIATAVVALVLGVLLVVFIVRQGRGHTAEVLDRRASSTGRTRIDLAVPRVLLADHLAENPDVIAARITAYAVRGTPTLKISVRARRGVSPAALSRQVIEALEALDSVLGEQLPAYVQISGGFRARASGRARVA